MVDASRVRFDVCIYAILLVEHGLKGIRILTKIMPQTCQISPISGSKWFSELAG